MERLHARKVERVLQGAKPGESPVERPTKFDLAANLATAEAANAPGGGSALDRFMFAVAAIVTVVFAVVFLIGLADGSVSSFNIVLGLGTCGAILVLGRLPRAKGRTKSAIAVLAVPGVPRPLYAFFIVLLLVSDVRWN